MVIEKVINNNIVSAYDDTGKEVVIMGRGIGFGTKPGREVAEQKIEKIFRIKSQSLADQFKELLANMPLEHAQISNDIISHAKKHLKLKLNQSIYVTLTDHINFAIERFTQGIKPENALLWEIKRFYQQEYQLGKYAVDMIWERLHIALPDDEAGFIALHFVNAEYGTDIRDALNFPCLLYTSQVVLKPECVLGLATGSTPIGAYDRLVEMYEAGDLDFSGVSTANLDEYKGLDRENDQSYYYFMHKHLFDRINIDPARTNVPNGMEPDSGKECRRYEELIASLGGVDLQLLGLGHLSLIHI